MKMDAMERYRTLLRDAPADAIEQAHAEAFAQWPADQRRAAFRQLSYSAPAVERARASEDPASLALLATRAELRHPGSLERILGPLLLASLAGSLIGTAVARRFFDEQGG